jgi:hypothetical protein
VLLRQASLGAIGSISVTPFTGRPWNYDNTDAATYDGTPAFAYNASSTTTYDSDPDWTFDGEPDWTYTPVS